MFQSINPFDNSVIAEYPPLQQVEILKKVQLSYSYQKEYRLTSMESRSDKLKRAALLLRDEKQKFATLMTMEMGKPVAQAEAEVEKCAWVCDYYAENAASFLSDDIVSTDARKSFIAYEPLGPVLAVMPWNFPFWQVFRFAAPALMAGNTGLLKHASNVSGCALAIEDIFLRAGFDSPAFQSLLIPASEVAAIIRNPMVKAVTLTGSTPAGIAVASAAGSVLKKCVLELGGSDPYVVLKDADMDITIPACYTAKMINNGQSCIAGKRYIVVKEVAEEFTFRLLQKFKAVKMGDPMDRDIDLGPMARMNLRDELHDQVSRSLQSGAKALLGADIPQLPGAFYPITLLTEVKESSPAFIEELFGPVAPIIIAEDEDDAIRLANQTVFGLGGAVFTRDTEKGEYIAKKLIQAGSCFVNAFVKSDPRLPFGGINESGYGRELSKQGIIEFLNIKTVYVK